MKNARENKKRKFDSYGGEEDSWTSSQSVGTPPCWLDDLKLEIHKVVNREVKARFDLKCSIPNLDRPKDEMKSQEMSEIVRSNYLYSTNIRSSAVKMTPCGRLTHD